MLIGVAWVFSGLKTSACGVILCSLGGDFYLKFNAFLMMALN